MMGRCCRWLLAIVVSLAVHIQTAEAQYSQFGANSYPRALSVTDPYGVPFYSWNGPPIGFNTSFYPQPGGAYPPGFGGAGYGNGFGGGIPVVASATTSEWVVQRTSVFPIYPYAYWGAFTAPWARNMMLNQAPPRTRPRVSSITGPVRAQSMAQQPPVNDDDASQQHAAQRELGTSPSNDATVVRPVSRTVQTGEKRSPPYQAEGDRWLREGENVKAYLRYLDAQGEAGDRPEVYFRQTLALVAMRRYSHAVSKLKTGLQVDPSYPRHGETLDEIFGVENSLQKVAYLQQVATWVNADVRDPDRLFLLGALLHFDEDSRASEYFNAAWKLARRGQHLQAFLQTPQSPPTETPSTQAGNSLDLPPPKDNSPDATALRPR